MKVREAVRASKQAEPKLTGYIQTDGSYFVKYVRPGNVWTGAALAMKAQQMKAGTTEPSIAGRAATTVSGGPDVGCYWTAIELSAHCYVQRGNNQAVLTLTADVQVQPGAEQPSMSFPCQHIVNKQQRVCC